MNDEDYLNLALAKMHTGQWFGFRKEDDNGDKIPNDQRMTYANVIVHDSSITKPTEEEVNAKIQELKDEKTARANARTSGKAKLKSGEALTDAEISALFGD